CYGDVNRKFAANPALFMDEYLGARDTASRKLHGKTAATLLSIARKYIDSPASYNGATDSFSAEIKNVGSEPKKEEVKETKVPFERHYVGGGRIF
ncbi:MAG: hypothetical protein Q7T03_08295, partial [Deltaproteobacteria bacterium]|nr:hypothetical protein [Deltaproteobacteria bacterium]